MRSTATESICFLTSPLSPWCCAWISYARRSPKPPSTGRGAAVLVSVVIVSATLLTALANVIEGSRGSKKDLQSAIEEVLHQAYFLYLMTRSFLSGRTV